MASAAKTEPSAPVGFTFLGGHREHSGGCREGSTTCGQGEVPLSPVSLGLLGTEVSSELGGGLGSSQALGGTETLALRTERQEDVQGGGKMMKARA